MLSLKRFTVLVFLAIAAPAQAAPPATLRNLVEEIAVQFPRTELNACRTAHPEHAETFSAALARFSARVAGLLTELEAEHAELAEPVPPAFPAFQAMTSALDDTDFRVRSLQECQERIREFDALQDAELKAGMTEVAASLGETIRTYRMEMERVMGIEPTS